MEYPARRMALIRTALEMSGVSQSDFASGADETVTLVRRTLEGDSAAFGEIILRHERRVFTLAMRLLGSVEDAQDAAQEVFFRAFRYLHRLQLDRPIEPWLMRMTVNVCRDIGRNRQRRRTMFTEMEQPENVMADPAANPHSELASEQQKRMLWTALNRLPNKERMAVILRDVEGLSTAEVATILHSSETTVRSQICRARLRMRQLIDALTGKKS
jgi:RNA polymerase sigma-70 factor, ECF subfamily